MRKERGQKNRLAEGKGGKREKGVRIGWQMAERKVAEGKGGKRERVAGKGEKRGGGGAERKVAVGKAGTNKELQKETG